MIEISRVSKHFGKIDAVNKLSLTIGEGEIFGLVGTNGAGKSTLLRMITGVLKPDEGSILIDGKPVYEAPAVKRQICFLAEESCFFTNATPSSMADYYQIVYPEFNRKRFDEICGRSAFCMSRSVRTFSKGMKKQLAIILGICAGTKYLICDETFDGLDPVMRQAVKGILAEEVFDRKVVPVIASHNMREIEDICDHIGLLHKGGILFSQDLDDMKLHLQKVQCVLSDPLKEAELMKGLELVVYEKRGSMITLVAKGTKNEIMKHIRSLDPVFAESLPLTLEEIFITETEVAGYGLKNFPV